MQVGPPVMGISRVFFCFFSGGVDWVMNMLASSWSSSFPISTTGSLFLATEDLLRGLFFLRPCIQKLNGPARSGHLQQ